MKKQNLITRIKLALHTALRYWCSHAASLKAMKKVYIREWQVENTGEHRSAKIIISRQGSMYHVTQLFYINDECTGEINWLASYGWHSNGHLMAIGSSRYLIFDPIQKLLYLEEWLDDERTVNNYRQI